LAVAAVRVGRDAFGPTTPPMTAPTPAPTTAPIPAPA